MNNSPRANISSLPEWRTSAFQPAHPVGNFHIRPNHKPVSTSGSEIAFSDSEESFTRQFRSFTVVPKDRKRKSLERPAGSDLEQYTHKQLAKQNVRLINKLHEAQRENAYLKGLLALRGTDKNSRLSPEFREYFQITGNDETGTCTCLAGACDNSYLLPKLGK